MRHFFLSVMVELVARFKKMGQVEKRAKEGRKPLKPLLLVQRQQQWRPRPLRPLYKQPQMLVASTSIVH